MARLTRLTNIRRTEDHLLETRAVKGSRKVDWVLGYRREQVYSGYVGSRDLKGSRLPSLPPLLCGFLTDARRKYSVAPVEANI